MTAVKAQANALMSKAMAKGDVNTRQQLTHDGWGGRGKVGAGHLKHTAALLRVVINIVVAISDVFTTCMSVGRGLIKWGEPLQLEAEMPFALCWLVPS